MEENTKKVAGQKLRELREKAGLSQGAVARAFNWKRGTFVSNWELGFSFPPLRYVPKLAKLYKVPTLTLRQIFASAEAAEVKHKYGLDRTATGSERK